MEGITLEQLKGYASQESIKNPYYSRLEAAIEDLIESGVIEIFDENAYFFYPKYLWQEDKNIELYLISKNIITLCAYDNEGNLHIDTWYNSNVNKLQLKNLNLNKREIQLEIKFLNDEQLLFSSSDSNDSWKYKFYKGILDIYKILR